jgi:hypothetical protein
MNIYSQFLERINDRGGADFTKIRPSDINWLFNAYDLFFFQNQITEKLKSTHASINFRVIKGDKSECRFEIESGGNRLYFFNISVSIFQNMSNKDGCFDRAICLMFVMEHQIIHLLMLLYNYQNKVPDDDTYSQHGPLYVCMLRTFFGDVDTSHDLKGGEKEPSGKTQAVIAKEIGRFSNVRNSCFLDSLLFVLLISDGSNYIRDVMFNSDIGNIPYNVKQICDRSISIRTRQQVRELAYRIREMLKRDYRRLQGGEVFQCNTLRHELRKCDPEIGTGDIYTPIEVYGIFAHLFPKLQVYFPPKFVVTETLTGEVEPARETVGITQKATFTDLEYYPYSIRTYGPQGPGSFYVWEDMNVPLLVFHNTGQKIHNFEEYIINRNYRLFGVVMSRGRVSTTEEGGGHYNAYLRINGQWFFYDDMPPTTLRRLEKLPSDEVFRVNRRGIAELLFYERIKETPSIPIKTTGTEKDEISFEPVEPVGNQFRLVAKYQTPHAGRVLYSLGGTLKRKGNKYRATWLLDYDQIQDKKDQILDATHVTITISSQIDGSVMIYAEDKFEFLDKKFRDIGGRPVEEGIDYHGLNYHRRNRKPDDEIRDYYWKVPEENFNDTLAQIQKA